MLFFRCFCSTDSWESFYFSKQTMDGFSQANGRRILIASGNRNLLSGLTRCLGESNYTIVDAPEVNLALDATRKSPPQLILLDVSWHDRHDTPLPQQFKDAAGAGEPLVVWVGEPTQSEPLPITGRDNGADDFLRFPADKREVLSRINALIKHHDTTLQLRTTEERYRSLFERSLDAVYLHDLDGNFLDANPAALELLGYTKPDLPSLSFASLMLTEADLGRARDRMQRLLEHGYQEKTEEYPLKRKDGTLVWVELAGSLVFDHGRPVAVQGIARNITERKHAAIKLAESENRFRAIFENAAIGLATIDPETNRILHCNAALANMFEYGANELCRMSVADVSHPDDHERDLAFGNEMLAGKRDRFIMEKRYRRKGGDWMWGKLTATVVRNDTGKARFVIGMVEDITEKKKAQEALEENAKSLATLMSNLPGTVYRCRNDRNWTPEFMSEGVLPLTGHPSERFLEGENQMFYGDIIHPEDRERVWSEVQQAFAQNLPFEITYRIITASGEEKWVWEKGRKVSEPGAPIEIIEGFITDITQQKTLEQNLLRAQRMESIGTLSGGIAHDLNNLLVPILMGLDLLEMSDPNPESRKIINNIRTSARRGADLVKQILLFAKGIDGARDPVPLDRLFDDIESIIRHTFPKNIIIERHVAEALPPIPADQTQIYQVILNLCLNARDAMPRGGRLTLSARLIDIDRQYAAVEINASPGPHVVIEVSDEGTGIPPETMKRIFEPFFTTKELGKGTGLGLSTSLGIIRDHGGFMKASSEPGVGSSFKVFLPTAPTEAPRPAEEVKQEEVPRGRGETVLLVDDEASVLNITQQTLEAWGYRVITAEDGAQAIRHLTEEAEHVDVVFMDMMMPVVDGFTLIKRLKELKPDLSIIATSGLKAQTNALQAEEFGVSRFIAKPFSTPSMLRLLRETLDARGS